MRHKLALVRRRWVLGGLVVVLLLASGAIWLATRPGATGPVGPRYLVLGSLPGAQVWNHGVSSLLFGTNDTYEYADPNIETDPAIQDSLRSAGFTLVRTFIKDNADDQTIERRIRTIELIGAQCLAVITNINDLTFNEHLVRTMGSRCLMYEFGNEPDYNGISGDEYLKAWNTTIPKLRQINPAARFIGPVAFAPQGELMRAFLTGVKASGVLPDAISFHWYACYNDPENVCQAKAGDVGSVAEGVRAMVRSIVGRDLPVGISEWNYDPGNPPPAYGGNASFITPFTDTAIRAMAAAGLAFACQFDAASYGGYGRLDMFNLDTSQPKPQFTALAALIASYRPSSAATPIPYTALTPNTDGPLISRLKPAYCSSNDSGPGGPQAIVDGRFGNFAWWETPFSALPGWCAIHVGAGPQQLLLAWYSEYGDYLDTKGMSPQAYTIATSSNSTNGADGTWKTVLSVTDNDARAREHLVPFAGMSWVKMTVAAGQPNAALPDVRIDEIELYDASKLGNATFLFMGDGNVGQAYDRAASHQPAFADIVHTCFSTQYPLTINAGTTVWDSTSAATNIQAWLTLNPDVHYWLIGMGLGDAQEGISSASFAANLQTLVAALEQAHRVPIFAHIPYTTAPVLDPAVQRLNGVIDQISVSNHLIAGPDFYALFQAYPTYMSANGLYPSDAGAVAMNAAWFQALRHTLASLGGTPAATSQCG